jgi:uncharacterized repeat protein (TIGR01451 family)
VTKTDSPDPVTAGTDLTYTITLDNAGPSDAQNVTLTDVLPAGTTFVSFSAPAAFTTTTPVLGGTGTVTATTPTFAAGATATFTLVVNVNANVPQGTVITNTVTVASTTLDGNLANNSDTETTTVQAPDDPDLWVTMSDTPDPVIAGGTITYMISVGNAGPFDAANVVLDDPVPAGTTFVSISDSTNWTCTWPPAGGVGLVSCRTASLAVGKSATFTLLVRVNSGMSVVPLITNAATVTYTTSDPNPVNNVATTTTAVRML